MSNDTVKRILHALADEATDVLSDLKEQMGHIESRQNELRDLLSKLLDRLETQKPRKSAYTVAETAELLGKRPFTVRQWCRNNRVNARKRPVGRGATNEWEVSAEEIERIRNHGLLPDPNPYRRPG